jgi:hypothetical protein
MELADRVTRSGKDTPSNFDRAQGNSEPEKWSEDRVELALANHGSKGLAVIINAELAAEREKLKAYVASVNNADRHNAKWQERAEKAEQQLLQAHAAIVKHNQQEQESTGYPSIISIDQSMLDEHDKEVREKAWADKRIEVELTAMKNHDAEVRKPLVELLRSVHTWFMQQAPQHYNGCGLWIDVDDELSRHPRENCILDVDSPTLPPVREEYLQCGCRNCRDALAKVKSANVRTQAPLAATQNLTGNP